MDNGKWQFKKTENKSPPQTAPRTPQYDEAPSFFSEVSKKSRINDIRKDIAAAKEEQVDVDLEKLTEHITLLLDLIEQKKAPHLKQSTASRWTWPDVTGLKKLKELLSSGLGIVCSLTDIISGPVKELLKGIGHASLATAGLLVVVYCLERYEELSSNKKECLKLLKEMCYVAGLVKVFKESRKGLMNVIEDATALIVEGAILCCTQIKTSPWKGIFKSRKDKADLKKVTEKLDRMYLKINVQMGFRKSPLWKRCPKHAVGITNSTEKVMELLECESKQNAVTVILHGFRGMGKTTLADAVFSKVELGYKYSKVRLFKDINSTPDIIEFQKAILKDLMEPEETLPDIRTHEDGQDALEEMLEKVEAFIYIDNVLKPSELQRLLPKRVDNAKKVRFLITATEIKDVKYACPTRPKTYSMKRIQDPAVALSILKKEIKEDINESQLKEIIEICGGVPLMLTLVASFIGRADDKQKAYDILKQEREKCGIPDKCKDPDPFLSICSVFKISDWDTLAVDTVEEEVKPIVEQTLSHTLKESGTLASQHDGQVIASCLLIPPVVATYACSSTEMINPQVSSWKTESSSRKRKLEFLNEIDTYRESEDK